MENISLILTANLELLRDKQHLDHDAYIKFSDRIACAKSFEELEKIAKDIIHIQWEPIPYQPIKTHVCELLPENL